MSHLFPHEGLDPIVAVATANGVTLPSSENLIRPNPNVEELVAI